MPDRNSVAQQRVVVVGGGWAGLSAAVELSHRGVPVTLLESAKQLGGRARCVRFGESRVDNGQHIMIGAYSAMLDLLKRLKLDQNQLVERQSLLLKLLSPTESPLEMRAPNLPAPLHLLGALLTAKGVSIGDKLKTVLFMARLNSRHFTLKKEQSVRDWLAAQPRRVVHGLWEPLCIATLNTPPENASARLFIRVLKEAFSGQRSNSDLLLPRTDLGTTIPEPAAHYIERHNGQVQLSRRVNELIIGQGRILGVAIDEQMIPASHVILATPHTATAQLLQAHEGLNETANQLVQIPTEPICTIYLRYPEQTRLELPMIGLLDSVGQWVIDRRNCGQPGLLSVVISANGPHMDLSNCELADHVTAELKHHYPELPEPLESLVIREKRATFASNVGINAYRPANRTTVEGLWLAGDYTDTGLPATLEGAIRSGLQCAQDIAAEWPQQN